MKKPSVLIWIEGGVVQGVSTNLPGLKVILVNYDKKSEEPVDVQDFDADSNISCYADDIDPYNQDTKIIQDCIRFIEHQNEP